MVVASPHSSYRIRLLVKRCFPTSYSRLMQSEHAGGSPPNDGEFAAGRKSWKRHIRGVDLDSMFRAKLYQSTVLFGCSESCKLAANDGIAEQRRRAGKVAAVIAAMLQA